MALYLNNISLYSPDICHMSQDSVCQYVSIVQWSFSRVVSQYMSYIMLYSTVVSQYIS